MNLKIPVTSADISAVKAMSKNERENLKIAINSARPRSIFENGGDKNAESVICPICGNGSGENHTPVVPHLAPDGQTWLYNCFRGSCSFKGDLIKIIATENNLDPKNNFREILAIGAKLINYNVNCSTTAPKSHYKNNQSARKIEETSPPEYERLAEARGNLPTLFRDRENFRGLSMSVLERLEWGYLTDFNHPKKPFDKYPAVIIPNVKGGIFARDVGNVKKMDNISPTAPTIINLFDGNDFILTIVEGAINGASLAYATDWKYSVVATGGTSGGKNLISFLTEKYPAQKPKILLMFDNDENDAGKDAAEKLLPELKKAGFIAVIRFIDERKNYDFNDFLLQEGKNALADRFNKIVADAQNDFVAERENFYTKWLMDNKISDVVKFSRNKKTDFTNSDTSILSVRVGQVNERTDIFMSTDTTVTGATVNACTGNAPPMHRPEKKMKEGFYTADEVAEILGVNKSTVTRWRQKNIFVEDVLDHKGVYWYSAERVEQLKSVYHKGWENIYKNNVRTEYAQNQNVKDSNSDSLEIELQKINKKIADFEQEKSAAIEKLKSAVSFDKDFCFSDEILTAAAFAKIFDKHSYSDFKAGIQNQVSERKSEKFIVEWQGQVKMKVADVQSRHADLLAQRNSLKAKITSSKFANSYEELKNFVIPEGYEISENGIEKIVGDKSLTVSRVPAFIQAKRKNFEEKTFKFVLAYLAENGTWQSIPAASASTVFNSRKLIDLSDFGLPVTSGNANLLVDFLDAFKATNEKRLPLSLSVSRCGWYNFGDKDYFVDTRRKNFISDADRDIEIVVDDNSTFAKSLKSVGSLAEWIKAYEIAKKSPIARLIVAASVAPPLLKLLGERNFVLYIYGTTRGGKSTCLLCGASAVGNTDMVISFDGTNNGLLGRAAETTDYPFFVDEKQSADARLKEQFQRFIYSVANGKERARANKDGSIKSVREWQNITICNGETELLDDNATGGAFTRLLQIRAPKTILAADDCKEIRRIIRQNYGHALPLVIDKIFDYGFDQLRENFNDAVEVFAENFPNLLDDYRRYVAIMTLADTFLNIALGVDEDAAFADAVDNAKIIFEFVPTIDDISDFEREKNFLLGFIAAKSAQFEGSQNFVQGGGREILGKFDDDFVYITARALKQACDESHFDYKKVVADSVENKFFVADEKIRKGRKAPYPFVVKKINCVSANCYRIPKKIINNEIF